MTDRFLEITLISLRKNTVGTRSDLRTKWLIGGLAVYVVAKMFYVFSGGLPQPADLFLLMAALMLTSIGEVSRTNAKNRFLIPLVLWICAINLYWTFARGDLQFLVSSSYYVFNALLFLLVAQANAREPELLRKVLNWSVIASGITQLAVLVLFRAEFRAVGTFQNPNELGYWANCSVIIYFITRRGRVSLLDFAVIGIFVIDTAASLSRAALGAILASVAIWTVMNARRANAGIFLVGALVGLAGLTVLMASDSHYFENLDVVSNFEQRLVERESVQEYSNRRYNRIFDEAQYLAVGAGEGAYDRFDIGHSLEIHSTLGTIIFCYGIVGVALFLAMLWRSATLSSWRNGVYLLPLLLYGLTHNGARFSLFWLVLGLVTTIKHSQPTIGEQITRILPLRLRRLRSSPIPGR